MSLDLPSWFPRSTFGLVVAGIYAVLALVVVVIERRESGGGWITLHGMGSFLVTFPVSLAGEFMGAKPDFRRNLDMAFAIGSCTLLVYFVSTGLARLAQLCFATTKQG